MYKIALILICAAVLTSCDKKEPADCEAKICTENFAMISFSFTDKDGNPAAVKNYSAINQRTGDSIKSASAAYMNMVQGSFIVVDDAYLEKLSAEGDDIKVSATSEATAQTKSAILKVSGGKCACHVQKLSGPEKLAFD
ncbi:hypothetical protein [Pedobacter heparinus]|uniref:hypothetical protein n=1 Tax=Pedobacter heparinus TaxID=984 RepID=UPI002931EED7|nr:hypothetical protein [Pedobacter heparinus]